jgi:hypothetical protein
MEWFRTKFIKLLRGRFLRSLDVGSFGHSRPLIKIPFHGNPSRPCVRGQRRNRDAYFDSSALPIFWSLKVEWDYRLVQCRNRQSAFHSCERKCDAVYFDVLLLRRVERRRQTKEPFGIDGELRTLRPANLRCGNHERFLAQVSHDDRHCRQTSRMPERLGFNHRPIFCALSSMRERREYCRHDCRNRAQNRRDWRDKGDYLSKSSQVRKIVSLLIPS